MISLWWPSVQHDNLSSKTTRVSLYFIETTCTAQYTYTSAVCWMEATVFVGSLILEDLLVPDHQSYMSLALKQCTWGKESLNTLHASSQYKSIFFYHFQNLKTKIYYMKSTSGYGFLVSIPGDMKPVEGANYLPFSVVSNSKKGLFLSPFLSPFPMHAHTLQLNGETESFLKVRVSTTRYNH